MSLFTFVCFIVFPAYGLRFAANPEHQLSISGMPRFGTPVAGMKLDILKELTGRDSLYKLQFDGRNSLEWVKTDCAPSMHVCLCLTCLFCAVRYRNIFRWKRASMCFWIIGVSSLIFSTVYLRYHWITDVALGAVLSMFSYFAAEKIYSVWIKCRFKYGLAEPEIVWLKEADRLRSI